MNQEFPKYLTKDFGILGKQLFNKGFIKPLELYIIDRMAVLFDEDDPEVLTALALAYHSPFQGHVGIDIQRFPDQLLKAFNTELNNEKIDWPIDHQNWIDRILSSSLVGELPSTKPFIFQAQQGLTNGLLMSRKFWLHQDTIRIQINRLASSSSSIKIDPSVFTEGVIRLFGSKDSQGARAVSAAVEKKLVVVTGGPGTGKTYSIKRLLALLYEQMNNTSDFRVLLAAPTGKAAARMKEALSEDIDDLKTTLEVKQAITNLNPSTIHRMLIIRPDGRTRYHSGNPLPADLVIVDEASMIDIVNMRRIFEAIPQGCSLILLGDRDQLASVDAGTVLSDIVSPVLDQEACNNPLLESCVVHFDTNHRFAKAPTVSAIARNLQQQGQHNLHETMEMLIGKTVAKGESMDDRVQHIGDPNTVQSLELELWPTLVQPYFDEANLLGALIQTIKREGIEGVLRTDSFHLELLQRFDNYRILGVHRKGKTGVETVEQWIQTHCASRIEKAIQFFKQQQGGLSDGMPYVHNLYLGQPIQILRNDYNVDLMNGDIGLVLPNQDGVLVAAFTSVEDGKKTLKHVQLTQLPPHVSSFCMTVHKSQGSQFSRVALLMAGQDSPIQTRELIYTALTRTKSRFDWIGNKKEMESALLRRITRASGLSDLLWHP